MPTFASHATKRENANTVSAKAVGAGGSAALAFDERNHQPQVVQLSGDSCGVLAVEMTQQQKIAAALMKAGISNPAAWAVAGVSPEAAVQAKPSASSAIASAETVEETGDTYDLHPPVVLMKGSHDPTFFISWRSQRDLIATLGWKSMLMIWGGPALTLVCIYILLAHFNWL